MSTFNNSSSNVASRPRRPGRRQRGSRGGSNNSSSGNSASAVLSRPIATLTQPFRWYAAWVRANAKNAQSLERLSRTFAMIVSDPSDLLNMEGCWTLSKMHGFVNQAIVQTTDHHVSATETLTYLLRAVQELECLAELLVRKYCRHQSTTWDVLLSLQSVKCVLNMCVHRQLFLMPWVWQSVRLYLRRVMRALVAVPWRLMGLSKRRKTPSPSSLDIGSSNAVSNRLHGRTLGPSGTRLVIPRVVSNRRQLHRHYFNPSTAEEGGGKPKANDSDNDNDDDHDDDSEVAWEKAEAEAIPFTFIDVLGMVTDAFLLIRPVLVVAAARRVFPRDGSGDDIAKIPSPPPKDKKSKAAKEGQTDDDGGSSAADRKAQQEQDHSRVLNRTMEAMTASGTLFPSVKWWGILAGLDLLVVLISRYIRAHRIPVVYMSDPAASQLLIRDIEYNINSSNNSNTNHDNIVDDDDDGSDGGGSCSSNEEEEEQETAMAGDINNSAGIRNVTTAATGPNVTTVPAVVSRDSLRLQHAMRNLGYTFLRDPFFTIVLKQFIYDHCVKGFINRVPLLGSLIAFQVGYFLSMQHYSFLHSVGQ